MQNVILRYQSRNDIRFHITDEHDLNWIGSFDSAQYGRLFVIIDENVHKSWGKRISSQLNKHGKTVYTLKIRPEEHSKSLEYFPSVIEYLEKKSCGRYDLLIAVGGGIVMDLVGFTASTYMRGVPFYAIPTTMIGQVDAITAGKTCMNSRHAKNVLGTFYYPEEVYNNIGFLKTNAPFYARQGFSEVFKYGLLGSKKLLNLLFRYQSSQSDEDLTEIVKGTIAVRSAIRKKDALASNLGHTFGHAIEKLSGFKVLHGDAISVGTVMALNYAKEKRLIAQRTVDEIVLMMQQLGLNIYLDRHLNADKMVRCMMHDKKSSSDSMHLVLLAGIAKPYEKDGKRFYRADPADVRRFLKKFIRSYPYRVENYAAHLRKAPFSLQRSLR